VNRDTQEAISLNEYSTIRCYVTALLVVLFVCASFAAVASLLLLIAYAVTGNEQDGGLLLRLGIKGAFFVLATAILGGSMFATRHRREIVEQPPSAVGRGALSWTEFAGLLAVLLMIAFEVAPFLSRYPWAAPDEMHHLVVARNVAAYGLYASGSPDKGFKLFDPYDSVGAPVILPVAALLRLVGMDSPPEIMLPAARVVMVAYYLLLCTAVFFLARGVLGPAATLAGILVMTASFGSTYLARTLYGEAPALAFLVMGLSLWRRGLAQPRVSRWLLLAGVFFGVSVLCKSIMALAAFAFVGAFVYDMVAFRKTRWLHFLVPGLSGSFVIAAWWALQASLQYHVIMEAGGTLGMYQHNLMFGYRSVGRAVGWMLQEPLALLGLVCGAVIAAAAIFRKRYDPPLVVLFLVAALFAFWWVFFTPGQIPRYVWFSYAIGALFAGAAAWNALRDAFNRHCVLLRRAIGVALVLIVLLPAVERVAREATEILTIDEMRDDRELALLIRDLPQSTRISTTYWPLERTLNFLARRSVEVIGVIPDRVGVGRLVIVDLITQPNMAKGFKPTIRVGRYAILTGTPLR